MKTKETRQKPTAVVLHRRIGTLLKRIKLLGENIENLKSALSRRNKEKALLSMKIGELESEIKDSDDTRRALKTVLLDRMGMDDFIRLMNDARDFANKSK